MIKRETIVKHWCAGRINTKIIKLFKVTKSTYEVEYVLKSLRSLVHLKTVIKTDDHKLFDQRT